MDDWDGRCSVTIVDHEDRYENGRETKLGRCRDRYGFHGTFDAIIWLINPKIYYWIVDIYAVDFL